MEGGLLGIKLDGHLQSDWVNTARKEKIWIKVVAGKTGLGVTLHLHFSVPTAFVFPHFWFCG